MFLNYKEHFKKYGKLIFGISLVVIIIIVVILGYLYQKNKKINLQYQKTGNKITSNIGLNIKNFTGKKEKYILNINQDGVKTELYVNGISVYSGNMASVWDVPITKYMKNGDNKVEINITKMAKNPNDVSCSFGYGYILNSDLSEDIIYSDKKFVCGESLKKNGVENFTFDIETNLPFDLPWENGKKFENNQITKEILFAKYKEMQNVLNSLNEIRIKEFFQYQLERKSQYMYITKEDIDKKYFEMVKLSLGDNNVTMLEILPIDELTLQISKDGFIARLLDIDLKTYRTKEPLIWYDSELEGEHSFPVWFMMTQGGEIIPIL